MEPQYQVPYFPLFPDDKFRQTTAHIEGVCTGIILQYSKIIHLREEMESEHTNESRGAEAPAGDHKAS
jgi:hypothetical protein